MELVLGKDRAPMALVHDGGVLEAIINGAPADYRLDVAYGERPLPGRRPLPVAADARRDRPAPDRRGPAREPLARCSGRTPAATTRRAAPVHGTSFAVWAPNARGVRVIGDFDYWQGHALPDALAGLVRRLGAVRAGRRRRRALQVPDARRRQPVAGQGRPDGVRDRGAAGHGVGGAHRPATVGGRAVAGPAGRDELAPPRRCRSTRCTSARGGWAGPTGSWPTSWSATSPRPASPTSSSCRWRSTRSAGRGATRSPPTTRRRRASATRTTSATSSTGCTRRASA